MSYQKCCVSGCSTVTGDYENILHRFPNPVKHKDVFNTWVYSVYGDKLGLNYDIIAKNRRICHRHFDQKYWCRNRRLSNIAIPTKFMADDTEDEDDPLRPTLRDDDSDKTDASSGTECLLSPERPESMRSPRVETEWLDTEEVFIPTETEWLLSPTEAESMLNPIETESMLTPVESKWVVAPMKTQSLLTSVETKSVSTHMKTASRLTPEETRSVPTHLKLKLKQVDSKSVPNHLKLKLKQVDSKSVPTHLKLKLKQVDSKSVPTHLKLKQKPVDSKSVPTRLKTAALVLKLDGSKSMLTPVVTQSMLTPVVTKSMLTPVVTKSMPTPVVTKSVLTPVVTKSMITPIVTKSMLTPVVTKSMLTPVVTQSMLTPVVTKSMLTPVVTKSMITPIVTKSMLIPVVTKSMLTPVVTKSMLTPVVTKSMLTPVVTKSMLTPVVTKSMLTPVVTKSMLTPVVTKSMLTPVVTKPVLTPMKTASKRTTTEIESLLASKVCRMCLGTNKTLQELNKSLSDYFLEICNCMNAPSKLMSCASCAESLENNLDFRNKCRKANQMFEEWKNDIKMSSPILINKRPTESLRHIEDNNRTIENKDKTELRTRKNLFVNYKGDIVILNVETETLDKNNKNMNGTIQQEIKTFPFGVDNEIVDKTYNNNNVGKRVRKDTLIENRKNKIANKENKLKTKSKLQAKTGPKDKKDNVRKKFKQRGEIAKRSEFSQYESVFDIQVFDTYADARRELESRRQSEPYLSARYKCEVCYTVYKNNGLLQFHMKWHDSSPELCHECDVCGMRFLIRGTLLGHKNKCHRAKFSCKLCPLVTYQGGTMKAHFQKHQGKKYTCHCKRIFNHISTFLTHKRQQHASSHVCVTCARTFLSKHGLQFHRHRMHRSECNVDSVSPSSVHCTPCGLTFPSRQVYTVHLLKTEEHKDAAAKIIACSLCGEEFDEAVQVKAHKRRDHKQFQYKTYKRPLKTKHISEDYQCKLCGAAGAGRRWLYGHYQREHPGEPYEVPHAQRDHLCDQCGKGFYTKAKLEEHELIHSGLKPFSCNICSKVFRTKIALKNHSERHMPATRECPHCGKKFKAAANLYSHIRCHTNDRRFVCTCCGKGFLHRAAMREHVRGVHLQIRRQKKKI